MAESNSTVAIEAQDVSISWGRKLRPVLEGISFRVEPGGFVWLRGQSGSGKSTLLRLMAGMHRYARGVMRVSNVDMVSAPERVKTGLRAQTVGLVLQDFSLIPGLSIVENIQLSAQLAGRRLDANEVLELMAGFGLQELGDREPQELSGGQQQRAALLRALVKHPDYLLVDEPTSALDDSNKMAVVAALQQLASRGAIVIASSHDAVFGDYATQRFTIQDGALKVALR